MSHIIGYAAETVARDYLIKHGLKWIASNFHSRSGEIDLVMQDTEHLVFVEVRSRVSNRYGGALASITYSKRQKIIKTAHYYLITQGLANRCNGRFDVVTVQGINREIEWIKNAFDGTF